MLSAEITSMDYGGGVRQPGLLFDCPNPRCAVGHSQWIPFSDSGGNLVVNGETIAVWRRVDGSTVDDLTLAPSILVRSCDGLHGHVVDGRWVPC